MKEVFGFDCYSPKVVIYFANLVGGAGMVGLVYWVIYRRGASRSAKGNLSS